METVKEPEVIDLDFTYGPEYVHLAVDGVVLCGAPSRPGSPHAGHGAVMWGTKAPTNCGCGAPVCPTCRHIHNTEYA